VRGFPVKAILPCEGVGYEIGSMAILKNDADATREPTQRCCGPFALRLGSDGEREIFPNNIWEKAGGGCWVRTNVG
jgi:hypothetical protein